MNTDREQIIAGAPSPVVRDFLRMADDSMVAILPYALSAAVRLEIADACSPGARNLKDLAQVLGVAEDALERLIRTLASCGFFEEDGEGRFAVTRLGQLLRRDSPVSMRASLSNIDSYRAWCGAVETISTGRPAFDGEFRAEFFAHKEKNSQVGAAFDDRMQERSSRLYAELPAVRAWHADNCVLDIGGGKGTMLAAILGAAPRLRGILFDRASVIERAETADTLNDVRDRCELIAGSFFEELPVHADVHLLCSVLHDWDDDKAIAILSRSRAALPEGGRVLICEMVVPEENEPHPARWSDLGMMVVLGGRERTLGQYRDLLDAARLEIIETKPVSGSFFSLIEARAL